MTAARRPDGSAGAQLRLVPPLPPAPRVPWLRRRHNGMPGWWWVALAVAAVATGALWPYAWTR